MISIVVLRYFLKKTNGHITKTYILLMGVLAAFVFAAQMLNTPAAAGISGHFLGGVLIAIFLGPWAGTVIMVTIIVMQAVLLQDGGILALGANIFNMGLIGTIFGYYLYRGLLKVLKAQIAAAGMASWVTIIVASAACALELAVSGVSPVNVILPAMVRTYVNIGIVEAAVTVFTLLAVIKMRPDLYLAENPLWESMNPLNNSHSPHP